MERRQCLFILLDIAKENVCIQRDLRLVRAIQSRHAPAGSSLSMVPPVGSKKALASPMKTGSAETRSMYLAARQLSYGSVSSIIISTVSPLQIRRRRTSNGCMPFEPMRRHPAKLWHFRNTGVIAYPRLPSGAHTKRPSKGVKLDGRTNSCSFRCTIAKLYESLYNPGKSSPRPTMPTISSF